MSYPSAELVTNRKKLIAWQRIRWAQPANGRLKLHLGCGQLRIPEYINCDIQGMVDRIIDLRELPYDDETVYEIVCQHALEHIPHRHVLKTLKEWYRVLTPGGELELGVPDIELCMQGFLDADDSSRWGYWIHTILGWQISDTEKSDESPFDVGQVHMAGLTSKRLLAQLAEVGFEIIESYHYDGNGTPSVFVHARRPERIKIMRKATLYEKDVVMGTFTNTTTYLPGLLESLKKHLPHIPFIIKMQDGPINQGMELLRQEFKRTNARYWIFLDHDIQFLNDRIIDQAISDLIANKWAACGVYSTFDPEWLTKEYKVPERLVTREAKWAVGYFILVDRTLVGDISADMDLPDPNTGIDTSYSAAIRARGYKIGISANLVYHLKKEVWLRPEVVEPTNQYFMKKWGPAYFEMAQYDGNVLEWPLGEVKL